MLDETRWQRLRPEGGAGSSTSMAPQLRLFGLLAILIPLFAGLQFLVREGVPRVEVRVVTQDSLPAAQVVAPVQVPVERVVERVVYVPVERMHGEPVAPSLDTAGGSQSAGSPVAGRASEDLSKPVVTAVSNRVVEPQTDVGVGTDQPVADAPPVTGAVAVAPARAAPAAVAPPPAPVARYVAPRVYFEPAVDAHETDEVAVGEPEADEVTDTSVEDVLAEGDAGNQDAAEEIQTAEATTDEIRTVVSVTSIVTDGATVTHEVLARVPVSAPLEDANADEPESMAASDDVSADSDAPVADMEESIDVDESSASPVIAEATDEDIVHDLVDEVALLEAAPGEMVAESSEMVAEAAGDEPSDDLGEVDLGEVASGSPDEEPSPEQDLPGLAVVLIDEATGVSVEGQ